MTPHELLVTCGVLVAAACWLAGNLAPWWRIVEWAHRDRLDNIWEDGRDYEREHGDPFPTVVWDHRGPVRDTKLPEFWEPENLQTLRRHDWRADYAEQLAPAVLDAENLPGPDSLPAPRAGEHHYEEFPLPAILHLGAEYDGGDQTFARVQLRQMTAINRHEAARKALLDECGVPWVPMEMCAA